MHSVFLTFLVAIFTLVVNAESNHTVVQIAATTPIPATTPGPNAQVQIWLASLSPSYSVTVFRSFSAIFISALQLIAMDSQTAGFGQPDCGHSPRKLRRLVRL